MTDQTQGFRSVLSGLPPAGCAPLRRLSTMLGINQSPGKVRGYNPSDRFAVSSSGCSLLTKERKRSDVQSQQTRSKYYVFPKFTKIDYSRDTGEGESFQPVVERFYRLNNGLWIRPRARRQVRRYRKSPKQRARALQHVVCNRTQSKMLDRFVEEDYLRPHYLPDDPYEPYHRKSNVLGYKYVPKRFYP